MSTTNLQIQNENSKSRLAIVHSAPKRVNGPKRTYSIEDYYDNGAEIEVNYYDQHEIFGIDVIKRTDLLIFINDFYRSTTDYFDCAGMDYHGQYEDTTSASDYLENNMREVLRDFLNQKRNG